MISDTSLDLMEQLHENGRPVPSGTVNDVLRTLGVKPVPRDIGAPTMEQEAQLSLLLSGASLGEVDTALLEGLATLGWRRWLAEFLEVESQCDLTVYGNETEERLRNRRAAVAIDLFSELRGDKLAGYAGLAITSKDGMHPGGPEVDLGRIANAAWGEASGGEVLLIGHHVSQYKSWFDAYQRIHLAIAESKYPYQQVIRNAALFRSVTGVTLKVVG